MDGVKAPKTWSQVAVDVLVQKYFRKAGVPQLDDEGNPESSTSGEPVTGPETRCPPGLRPPRRLLDPLGQGARLLRQRGGRPGLPRRAVLHAGRPVCRAQLTAVVQHRAPLGLRHHRPRPGPLVRRPGDRRAQAASRTPTSTRSRTPASSSRSPTTWSTRAASWTCGPARPGCSSTARAPGTNFSQPARRGRAALRRRPFLGPDVLPQDRRPRRRRHQIRRHHPPRGQDGLPGPRPPRHRGVHRLEGGRRAQGGGPGRRLAVMRRQLQEILDACFPDGIG